MNLLQYLRTIKQQTLTQTLPGTYKQPFSGKICIAFLILGLSNIILGIILLIHYSSLFSTSIPYKLGISSFSFTIPESISNPIYFYLDVDDFYQTHFFYSKSVSMDQLSGKPTTNIKSCYPLKYTDNKIIYPCGLISNTFIQDKFSFFQDNKAININVNDISWTSVKEKIKNTEYSLDQIVSPPMWLPYKSVPKLENNLRFANWMAPSSFPHFRKLYGKIENGLDKGDYRVEVESTFVYGNKSVVLAESSWAGVKNYFLGVVMVCSGVILMVGGMALWMKSDNFSY